jgi:hypothetical protein
LHWKRLDGAQRRTVGALVLVGAALAGACIERPELTLPTADQVESYYSSVTDLDAEIRGNLAEIKVVQSANQLRRGGSLWARVGPYIYLFTEETYRLFQDFPGLAGVRVVTQTAGGVTVASAMLTRDELSDVLWRRSLNIAGHARRDGTERPALLEDLIRWGEEHTEFEYSESYNPRR